MSRTPTPAARRARGVERRLPLGAPVRAWSMAEWALLPLRLFLGATFLYAGLQKLANPNFFRAQSPISIQAQLIAASHTSPLHALLIHLISQATPIGIIISFSEVAIGIGVLVGLWTRIAALGGAILSFSLFLTISFHASPYFTGADIVFFFAWLPSLSREAARNFRPTRGSPIASRRIRASPRPSWWRSPSRACKISVATTARARAPHVRDWLVTKPSAPCCSVGERPWCRASRSIRSIGAQSSSGHGRGGRGRGGADLRRCRGRGRPDDRGSEVREERHDASHGSDEWFIHDDRTRDGTDHTDSAGHAARERGRRAKGHAAAFTIPSSGDPGIVIHADGAFFAYDAVCPHAGCTVGYYAANDLIVCPCHGSEFAVTTGDVINGPAPHGLAKLKIVEGSNGNLYLQ